MERLLKKDRNKRCDRLATHVFLFSAKNRIYKQNTVRSTPFLVSVLDCDSDFFRNYRFTFVNDDFNFRFAECFIADLKIITIMVN